MPALTVVRFDHCASSCTQEENIKMMARCVQLDMECAAICYAVAQLINLSSETAKDICRMCADICEACDNECGKYETEHCQKCSQACKQCAEECRKMAAKFINAGFILHSFSITTHFTTGTKRQTVI